jgi:beta-lactamase regulating signal transducer with metallopeptidase domain
MSESKFESPSPESMGKRIAIGTAGVLLLAVGVIVTFGVALIGVAAILASWYVIRRRDKPLTRSRAWMVSVVAIVIPLFVAFAVGIIATPRVTPEERRAREADAARSRESMPDWLNRLTPNQQQTAPVADSIANKLLDNRGFMIWVAAFGALIGASFTGAFAGTFAWGATMLLFRSVRGEWMGKSATFPLR